MQFLQLPLPQTLPLSTAAGAYIGTLLSVQCSVLTLSTAPLSWQLVHRRYLRPAPLRSQAAVVAAAHYLLLLGSPPIVACHTAKWLHRAPLNARQINSGAVVRRAPFGRRPVRRQPAAAPDDCLRRQRRAAANTAQVPAYRTPLNDPPHSHRPQPPNTAFISCFSVVVFFVDVECEKNDF